MKHFNNLVDAVGDQDMKSSLICISPLRHTLAFNLSRPPYMFSFVLHANFAGMISSAGSGFSFKTKVSLSKRPVISDFMASPHLSLVDEDILKICDKLLGSGMKSDKLTCFSISMSSSFLI